MKNSLSLCEASLRRAAETYRRISSEVSAELRRRREKHKVRFFPAGGLKRRDEGKSKSGKYLPAVHYGFTLSTN